MADGIKGTNGFGGSGVASAGAALGSMQDIQTQQAFTEKVYRDRVGIGMNSGYEGVPGANGAWLRQLGELVHRPQYFTKPRGYETMESLAVQLSIDMKFPVLSINKRDLGYKFMAAEAWWILSGRDDVASIAPYSKEISRFSDDGVKFFGAYGPKIHEQWHHVVTSLLADNDSRQAVINIWRELPPHTKDTPCTLSLQWLIRGNKLHCIATMRSSDIWLGLPYDAFNFSMLTWKLALELGHIHMLMVEPGTLVMQLGSSHLYAKNLYGAHQCLQDQSAWSTVNRLEVLSGYGIVTPTQLVDFLAHVKDDSKGLKGYFGG